MMARWAGLAVAAWLLAQVPGAAAADKFFAFNLTTATNFTGLALAPEGTENWGPNQALNDPDHVLDASERLTLKGIQRGRFDVKLQTKKGCIVIKHGVDLTHDLTFDIRDGDLGGCR